MLLPPRFHIADEMPMSLGKAIAKAIAPKVDPNAWFEEVAKSGFLLHGKDFKGAAPESKSANAGTLLRPASTDAAPPSTEPGVKFRVGDKVRVIEESTGWMNAICTITELRDCRALSLGVTHDEYGSSGLLKLCEVEPFPSPDAEADGWVTHDGSATPPIPLGTKHLYRWRNRSETYPLNGSYTTAMDGEDWSFVTAYKVLS